MTCSLEEISSDQLIYMVLQTGACRAIQSDTRLFCVPFCTVPSLPANKTVGRDIDDMDRTTVKPHIALVPKLETRPVEAEGHDGPQRVNEVEPEGRHAVERRTARRYMISASAEVSDVTSGVKLAARVADISITGCYLDSINSFPEGTRLCLHIRQGDTEFNGEGTVRYAKSGMGMGLAFLHLDDAQNSVLQGWIERLDPSARLDAPRVDSWPSGKSQATSTSRSQVSDAFVFRLIELLREKDLLSEADVTTLFHAAIL
jgi:hypothetical protein